MIITSKSNPKIKEIASLKDKKFRKKCKKYVVEGFKMVNEAVLECKKIDCIVGTMDGLARVKTADYPVVEVNEIVFEYLSDAVTPQGVLAVLFEDENSLKSPEKPCILLDRVQDPGNVGTIIRTAVAAGVKDVYLLDCCDPYSPKAVRSSMSGIFFINLHFVKAEDLSTVFANTPLIVADMGGENVFNFNPPKSWCLVVGNEANGVSDVVQNMATHTVKIPMSPKSESLNAGISLAVTLYELTEGKGNSLI